MAILRIGVIATVIALSGIGAAHAAETYPTRPIRLIVAFPPGGSSDYIARLLQPRLENLLGQPIVIDNRGGGGGVVALEGLHSAPADGYTVALAGAGPFTSPIATLGAVTFNPQTDFAPVTIVAEVPFILAANPSLPEKTLAELVSRAKSNPQSLSIGHGGNGTAMQFTALLFNHLAGVNVALVPYRGTGPVMNDLLGSHIALGILDPPTSLSQIQAGKIRPFAISTKTRFAVMPEVPTFEEGGLKGFEFSGWFGISVRTGTSKEIIDRLNQAFVTALREPEIAARIRAVGAEPKPTTPAEQQASIEAEAVTRGQLSALVGDK